MCMDNLTYGVRMGQEERRWLIMELSDLVDSRLQRFVFGQSNV